MIISPEDVISAQMRSLFPMEQRAIPEIFRRSSTDNKVAVCDPVYPVYVDTNVMAGRTGLYNKERENFDGVIYMPCKEENGFLPRFRQMRYRI